MSAVYEECGCCGKIMEESLLNDHECADACGECRGGAQQILQQVSNSQDHYSQSRLAALREVREMLDTPMTQIECRKLLDIMIAKEEGR